MAVVGEAHILVRAITTGVNRDIQRAFKGLSGEGGSARRSGESLGRSFSRGFNSNVNGNIFSRITEGLNNMAPAAAGARKRFQSLVRTGYTLGTAVSIIIGGIASLASGLLSLVGAAGAAAVSVVGLVGAFVSLRIGLSAASFAMKGISAAVTNATNAQGGLGRSLKEINKQFRDLRFQAEAAAMSEKRASLELEKARNNLARMQDLPPNNMARREAELALEEAELNFRQAKARSKDLNNEVSKGKKGLMETGGVDPYAGLTKSQKEFAQLLVKLNPKLDELREAVAKGFLPLLGKQLEKLANGPFFDVIKKGLTGIGESLGVAAKNFVDFVDSQINLDKLDTVFENSKPTIEGFGTILGKAFDGFLSVLVFADPIVKQFIAFLDRNLTKFKDFMNAPKNKAEIEGFFATVKQLATDFGKIFGNIFGGFGKIISANIGPGSGGQILIDYLKEITGSFANLEEINGKPLKEFFAGAAEQAESVLGSLGALLGEIFNLADNPAIGETFDILKEGAAPLGEILTKYIEAGPNFAELVVTLTELSNRLTDTGGMQVFFDTLNSIATVVNDFFGNETVQKVFAVTAKIFAFLSAIGLAVTIAKFFGNVIVGSMLAMVGPIGAAATMLGKLGTFLLRSPILIAIAILIAAFVYLYNTSDSFREFVDVTLKSVLDGLGESFGRVMTALQPLIDLFTGELLPTLMEGLQPVLEVIVAAVGGLAIIIGEVLATAIEVVVPIIMSLMQILKPIIDIFMSLITLVAEFAKALMTGDWDAFGKIFMKILRDIAQGVVDLFTGLGNIIIDVLNWAISNFYNGIGGGIADIVKGLSGGSIDLKKPGFVPKIPQWTIPAFAHGGVVGARPGGTLAMVAEAGRPERIEPLDANGLSLRDKEMISALSSGGSGTVINVYPSAGMDERELSQLISRRLAFEVRKGAF